MGLYIYIYNFILFYFLKKETLKQVHTWSLEYIYIYIKESTYVWNILSRPFELKTSHTSHKSFCCSAF
jgi:hypothetical protein